jgi:hypothetical protein
MFLSISPIIDTGNLFNKGVIETLKNFLLTKNNAYWENKFWLQSEFKTNVYPFYDLYNIENSKLGKGFYKPSLMEIIPTDSANQKIVKIAFIGHDNKTNENILRAVYNIVATKNDSGIVFSMYLNFITKDWKEAKIGSVTYKISPEACRTLNMTEALKQKKEIAELCDFFGTVPIPIHYYSCINPVEVFQIKGFDYNPLMYVDKSGGLNEPGDNIISGNNSDYYMHEVAHSYIGHLFPAINSFLNEGFAMLIGGSGKFSYEWHRNKMKKYLEDDPAFSFADHTINTWEPLFIDKETQITYMLGALICERTLRLYGKEKLFEIFKSKSDLFDTLKDVGLTKENLNEELRKEIKLPLTSVLHKRG